MTHSQRQSGGKRTIRRGTSRASCSLASFISRGLKERVERQKCRGSERANNVLIDGVKESERAVRCVCITMLLRHWYLVLLWNILRLCICVCVKESEKACMRKRERERVTYWIKKQWMSYFILFPYMAEELENDKHCPNTAEPWLSISIRTRPNPDKQKSGYSNLTFFFFHVCFVLRWTFSCWA